MSSIESSSLQFNIKINEETFEHVFEIEEELGRGQFAIVKRVRKRSTNEVFAAKFIKKRRYANSRRGVPLPHIYREIDVLHSINGHANVIQCFEVSGGELFDYVCMKEYLDEAEASSLIRQILLAIRHIHSHNVVHLDIKPENIMLKKSDETQIKIIDFGLSRKIYLGTIVKDMVGTPEFVAPEVVNYEPLSYYTDIWAVNA